jgi:hypothetical protein
MLYAELPPSICARNHRRCWAKDSVPSRGTHDLRLATDLRYAEALGDRRQFRVGEQIGQRQFSPSC